MGFIQVWDRVKSLAIELEKIGVEEPQIESEIFLSDLLGIPRSQLVICDPINLTEAQDCEIQNFLIKRKKRIPIQHILGNWNFYGLDFLVNENVLIPRPETEGLVEIISEWIQLHKSEHQLVGLDWGTGSGCIPVSLLSHHNEIKMKAVDISGAALAIAQINARNHRVDDRLELFQSDGLASVSLDSPIDFFVSNPPYIRTSEISSLAAEVKDHDPIVALDGGSSGIEYYQKIFDDLHGMSVIPKFFAMEIGADQGPQLMELFNPMKQFRIKIQNDLLGRDRYLVGELN